MRGYRHQGHETIMGRPSIYSDKLAEDICERLANGESMVQICQSEGMPGLRTVMRWAADNPDFGTEYAWAREAQAEVMDHYIYTAALAAGEDPAAARVKIDAYKWRAAKLAPKRYGDKTLVGSDPDNPLPAGFQVNLVKSNAAG
jgi:hypothetical protein